MDKFTQSQKSAGGPFSPGLSGADRQIGKTYKIRPFVFTIEDNSTRCKQNQ